MNASSSSSDAQQQQVPLPETSNLSPKWQRRFDAFLKRKERLQVLFERHRTLLSLSATILSCLAALAGYQSRRIHQERLERRLSEI